MLRILFIFLLMLAVFPAASVLAQDPPPPPPPASIFIQPIREAPGTPVTVQGSNFAPNTSVSITYGNTTVATVSTGNGSWTQSFIVPESPLGSHTVKAGTVSATFTVTSSVFVSISQGKVGSQATVRGDGFSANQGGITVAFDGEEVGTASADSLGSFTTTFVVPPRPRGTYQVQIGSSSIQNFTVISSLTLSPFTGPPGTTVDLIGSGFNADSNLSITFEGEIGRTISVDSQGSITTTFQIPVAAGGPRMIGVYHPSRGSTQKTFTVTPTLSLDRLNIAPGGSLTATGSGFAANERAITVTIDQTPVATRILADINGSWTTSLIAPSLPSGSHSARASGSLTPVDKVPPVTLTLGAGLDLERSSGPPGSVVEARGSGFAPSESITITAGKGLTEFAATANSRGVWTANVTIPPAPTGRLTIQASSAGNVPVETDFTVTPSISIIGTGGEPGSSITAVGSGFGANEVGIAVTLDQAPVATGVAANAEGSWTASFTLPSLPTGSYTLLASGSLTASSSFSEVIVAVRADLTLERSSGPPGTEISIRGAGFKSGERVTVTMGQSTANTIVVANNEGIWTANIIIPAMPRGVLAIRASGASGQQMAADFTVIPGVSLSQATGSPTSSLEIKGLGFGGGRAISIKFEETDVTSSTANAQGSWSARFPIPEFPAGAYSITVVSPRGEVRVPFRVTPSIVLSDSHGEPGASVDLAGFGFAPNEKGISVTLNETQLVSGISAGQEGSWRVTFTVPSFPSESYTIEASGPQTSTGSLPDEIITIAPRVTVSPASGTPGSVINLTGSGFRSQERDIVISYDGIPVATVLVTDARGGFTASFTVPESTSGLHFISHTGAVSLAAGGSEASFQVVRGISLDDAQGAPDSSVSISGSGFAANDPLISIVYDGDQVLAEVLADPQGSFTTSILIPPSPAGSHLIQVTGSDFGSTTNPELEFSVTQTIALNVYAGNVGQGVEVAGLGFEAAAPVTLTYDDEALAISAVADASGSFVLEFPIPASIHGDHTIKISDEAGHEVQAAFSVENTPPGVATLIGPENGARGGILGGFRPALSWRPVDDDSGVTYELQVATSLEFTNPIVEKLGLVKPAYELTEQDALARGAYHWRVRAVDGASNEAPWSDTFAVKSGLIAPWLLALIMLGMIVAGGGGYFYFNSRRTRMDRDVVFPALARDVAVGPALPPHPGPKPAPALRAPFRLALPAPSRRRRSRTPEEQAHLQLVLDFMRSLPLIQLTSDLKWLDELMDSVGGGTADVYEQILQGQLDLGYQPEWLRHPTYAEVQRILEGHEFLQRLDEYIQAVSDIAVDTVSLIRQVYEDAAGALPEATQTVEQWRFDLAVVQHALGWYRGTYLRQASTRDYLTVPVTESDGESLVSLHGDETTPFPGRLIGDLNEDEALVYRDLHIQMRANYTNSEEARLLAARMVSVDLLRDELLKNLSELDQTA